MAGQVEVQFVGNLTADPELSHVGTNSAPVVNFSVAVTDRRYDAATEKWIDGDTTFMRCTVWRKLAENFAATARKGTQLIVIGTLRERTFEHEGVKRRSHEVDVSAVGPSLQFATAVVSRASASSSSGDTTGDGFVPPADYKEMPAV